MNTSSKILTALAVSVLLTACPGSGDSSSSTTTYTTIYGLAYDSTNSKLYIANAGRSTIQSLDPSSLTNTPVTLAGGDNVTGTTNGDGTAARFNNPMGLAMTSTTTLVVADTGNSLLRKITSLTGTKTVANYATGGSFSYPIEMAVLTNDLYVADANNHAIKKISLTSEASETWAGTAGTSGTTTSTTSVTVTRLSALFNQPTGIAIDTTNNVVYVSDSSNHTIRKIDITSGTVTTIAGVAGTSGYKNSATGSSANFYVPTTLVFTNNALYVTDTRNHAIRKIDTTTNAVTTFAGSAGTIDTSLTAVSGSTDGTSTAARFYTPRGIALNGTTLYVGDQNGTKLRKIDLTTGVVTTFTTTF
ncbi:NHL repeat [Burkholderiaceae bacterium]